jgi:hypothetical protein
MIWDDVSGWTAQPRLIFETDNRKAKWDYGRTYFLLHSGRLYYLQIGYYDVNSMGQIGLKGQFLKSEMG